MIQPRLNYLPFVNFSMTSIAGVKQKKKRRPKLAPRYSRSGDAPNEEDAEERRAINAQQAELVREVFTTSTCRCFVLKSFSEGNFHKSLKFGIWSTTTLHNALLDQVFKSDLTAVRPVLFFFRWDSVGSAYGLTKAL